MTFCYTLIARSAVAVVSSLGHLYAIHGLRIFALEIGAAALGELVTLVELVALLWLSTGFGITRVRVTPSELQVGFLLVVAEVVIGGMTAACSPYQTPYDVVDAVRLTVTTEVNCDTVLIARPLLQSAWGIVCFVLLGRQERAMLKALRSSRTTSSFNVAIGRRSTGAAASSAASEAARRSEDGGDLGDVPSAASDDVGGARRASGRRRRGSGGVSDVDGSDGDGVAMGSRDASDAEDENEQRGRPHDRRSPQSGGDDAAAPRTVPLPPLCTVDTWLRIADFRVPYLVIALLPLFRAAATFAWEDLGNLVWLLLVERMALLFLSGLVVAYFYDVAAARKFSQARHSS
jgi:hypothetical protein